MVVKWISCNFTCSSPWKEWSTGCCKRYSFLKDIAVSQFEGTGKWEKNRNKKLLNLTFLLLSKMSSHICIRPTPSEKIPWNILLNLSYIPFNKLIFVTTSFDRCWVDVLVICIIYSSNFSIMRQKLFVIYCYLWFYFFALKYSWPRLFNMSQLIWGVASSIGSSIICEDVVSFEAMVRRNFVLFFCLFYLSLPCR